MADAVRADDPTALIAEYVQDLTYEDLPELAKQKAKWVILDTIGVALVGSQREVSGMVAEYVEQCTSSGPSSVFGRTFHTSPEHAALANGVMAHAMDFDDRHHSSTHVLTAPLAVGEMLDASGKDLLLAYVIGREVRMHLNEEFDSARFQGKGPGSRGWHATGTLGSLGAAAGVAKMLGLDASGIANAFGIAASLCSGLIANFGKMAKSLHAGNAARNGVLAGILAGRGFTGEPTILTSHMGLVEAMCLPGECDAGKAAASLAASFHIVDHGIQIKPYPSCSENHPYIATVLAIRDKYGVTADTVASIETTMTGGLNRAYPTTELEAKFSAAYNIAIALLEGTFKEEHCAVEFIQREDVQRLLSKITYSGAQWGGSDRHLRITTISGQVIEEPILAWRNLTTYDEVRAKFYDNATGVVGEKNAQYIESAVMDLEHVPVRALMSATSKR